MVIYTYQPQDLIDALGIHGFVAVDFTKTNLYKQTQAGTGSPLHHDAYMWMAQKLSEKTGLWMKSVYGDDLDLPKDSDGDYIDGDGQKVPLLPFWGWYLTDGKNQKPDPEMYCFDNRVASVTGDWSMNESKTMLLTLNVPEKLVLLSDANAWYCVLEGRPCYEYEEESVEAEKLDSYRSRYERFLSMPEKTAKQKEAKTAAAEELWRECVTSWDNILRLEGLGQRRCTYRLMDELIATGSGRRTAIFEFRKAKELIIGKRYIELQGRFGAFRAYVAEEDFDFVKGYIQVRVPMEREIRKL